jgi:O-acetyl-ADP-ribose deacetylase (regulator of RNase III)
MQDSPYYQDARLDYLNEPFYTTEAKKEFQMDRNTWGTYCNTNRSSRRIKYRSTKYYNLSQITESAFNIIELTNNNNNKKAKIMCSKVQIQTMEIDAIVNAANESLLGGGGVDRAIHNGAGALLVRECATYNGGCEVGDAKITKGYCLPANYVIHTVGPCHSKDDKPDSVSLANCYKKSLEICDQYKLQSIAFPCISTGVYGFPKELAAKIAYQTVTDYLLNTANTSIQYVIFSLFENDQVEIYKNTIK